MTPLLLMFVFASDPAPPPDADVGPPLVVVKCYVFRSSDDRYFIHFDPENTGDRRPWIEDGGVGPRAMAEARAYITSLWIVGEWRNNRLIVRKIYYDRPEGP